MNPSLALSSTRCCLALVFASLVLPAVGADAETVELTAQADRIKAEVAVYEAQNQLNAARAKNFAGGKEPPALPTGAYTLGAETATSPVALHLSTGLLLNLSKALRTDLTDKLGKTVTTVVLTDTPEQPATFWRWAYFIQQTEKYRQETKALVIEVSSASRSGHNTGIYEQLSSSPSSVTGFVALAAAVPAAINQLAGLFRRDVTETASSPNFGSPLLRDALLAPSGLSDRRVFFSPAALAGAEFRSIAGLQISLAVESLRVLVPSINKSLQIVTELIRLAKADKNPADEAKLTALKAKLEALEKNVAGLDAALRKETEGESGFVGLVREELLLLAYYGAQAAAEIATGTGPSLLERAAASPVRLVRVDLARQAMSRVETKTAFLRRYHYEATLVASYAIFTPSGQYESGGTVAITDRVTAPKPDRPLSIQTGKVLVNGIPVP